MLCLDLSRVVLGSVSFISFPPEKSQKSKDAQSIVKYQYQ